MRFLNIFRGEIAIDDIMVTIGPCQPTSTCDFESVDLCGYKSDNTGDFDWIREQGNDGTFDHSYGSSVGHYMKAMSPSNPVVGRSARLLSPSYPSTTLCAHFWFKTTGNLHLNLKTYSFGSLSSNTYFKFRGSNGNKWELGQATVSHPYAFQLVFESLVSVPNSMGYALLDDIEIRFKPCAQPASCNFEEDLCGYKSLKDADFEWIILDGQFGVNQNIWLVPQFDNTIGSVFGHFIYLDGLQSIGSKAKIHSELIIASSSIQCVQFYVYMKKSAGIINVYRENKINLQSEKLYTENAANLDDLWYEREVELNAINLQDNQDIPVAIIFEGVIQNREGALAIDDIKLYNGNCLGLQDLPTVFDCGNGHVVNTSVVCDFINDCSNGRDEKVCGTCDFEDFEYCGWFDKSIGSYYWLRSRNGSLETNKPTTDHTFGNQTG